MAWHLDQRRAKDSSRESTVCKKKSNQCRSSDHHTHSKSSQESNHSGQIVHSTAEDSVRQELVGKELSPLEEVPKKPKVLLPVANEKASYRSLEEKVYKRIFKLKGSTEEELKKLASPI